MDVVIENECKYRLAWINPDMQGTQYGEYLFDVPSGARDTKAAMKKMFPDYVVWLEDHEHNRIEIPR
jgi:hypothetical protein